MCLILSFTHLVQDAVDSFIMKSCQNPLVLANMATSRKNVLGCDVNEWNLAGEYLVKLLVENKEVKVSAFIYNQNYPKDTIQVASMIMAIDSISKEEQMLLLFASICEDQSIPEVLLKLFFKKINGDIYEFSTSLWNLQQNNLLKESSEIVPWSNAPQKSWIVHSMRQKVIASIKATDISLQVAQLLEGYPSEKTVVILLALFGQQKWRDLATSKLINSSGESKGRGSAHFYAIQPFVWLLRMDCAEPSEKKSNAFVEQVFDQLFFVFLLTSI